MRKSLKNLKITGSLKGDQGKLQSWNWNQAAEELTTACEQGNVSLDTSQGADVENEQFNNIGDTTQLSKSIDALSKQLTYTDISTKPNEIIASRKRDKTPINPEYTKGHITQLFDEMSFLVIVKNNNTETVVTMKLDLQDPEFEAKLVYNGFSGDTPSPGWIKGSYVYLAIYRAELNNNIGAFLLYPVADISAGGGGSALQVAFGTMASQSNRVTLPSQEEITVFDITLNTITPIFTKNDQYVDNFVVTFSANVGNIAPIRLRIDGLPFAKAVMNIDYGKDKNNPIEVTQNDLNTKTSTSVIKPRHTYRAIYHKKIDTQPTREAFWRLEEIGSIDGFLTARNHRNSAGAPLGSLFITNSYNENVAPGPYLMQSKRITRNDNREINQAISEVDNPVEFARRGVYISQEIDYPINQCVKASDASSSGYVWDYPLTRNDVQGEDTLTGATHRGGLLRRKIIRFSVELASIDTQSGYKRDGFGVVVPDYSYKYTEDHFNGTVPYIYSKNTKMVDRLYTGTDKVYTYASTWVVLAYIPYSERLHSPKDVLFSTLHSEDSKILTNYGATDVPAYNRASRSRYEWFTAKAYLSKFIPRNLWVLNKQKVEEKLGVTNLDNKTIGINQHDAWWVPSATILGQTFCTSMVPDWASEFAKGYGFFLNILIDTNGLLLRPGSSLRARTIDFAIDMTYIERR